MRREDGGTCNASSSIGSINGNGPYLDPKSEFTIRRRADLQRKVNMSGEDKRDLALGSPISPSSSLLTHLQALLPGD